MKRAASSPGQPKPFDVARMATQDIYLLDVVRTQCKALPWLFVEEIHEHSGSRIEGHSP